MLLGPHPARRHPSVEAPPVAVVGHRRPITGDRTVLPVLADTFDDEGRPWLRVRLPGRTLGRKPPPRVGWIRAWRTRLSSTPWHIVVDTRARRLSIYRAGRRLRGYPVIVGNSPTPTPLGEYFVEENVQLSAGDAGAPFALATSARSSVLQEFAGGPGQIALHGIRNIGGRLGTAASHGCIRMSSRAITWLAARIAPGVPVSFVYRRRPSR